MDVQHSQAHTLPGSYLSSCKALLAFVETGLDWEGTSFTLSPG